MSLLEQEWLKNPELKTKPFPDVKGTGTSDVSMKQEPKKRGHSPSSEMNQDLRICSLAKINYLLLVAFFRTR